MQMQATDKRDGSGSHNWGTVGDDMAAQLATDETHEQLDRSGDEALDTAGETTDDQVPEEEGPKEMTLEEYKKLEEVRLSVICCDNVRPRTIATFCVINRRSDSRQI